MLGKGDVAEDESSESVVGQCGLSFQDPTLGAAMSQSPSEKHPNSCRRVDTHSSPRSPSDVWLSMSVWLRMSLTSSPVPTIPPTHRHTCTPPPTRTELSLFPICHPLLSRQQCGLSKVLVIDCYCKVGRALRDWISDDWIKLWGSCLGTALPL